MNCKVRLCLDKARLNKALIRPVYSGSTLNDILWRLACIKYLTLIDASSGYHNLKQEKKSYLTTFSHLVGRYRYIRLSIGPAPAGEIFQTKIDELVSGMVDIFGIADVILIASFDEQDKDQVWMEKP